MSSSNPACGRARFARYSQFLTVQRPSARVMRGGLRIGLIACAVQLVTACGLTIDYKRLTYDILRQADCRENDVDDFCSRTFVFEYDEYEAQRREYLRIEAEKYTDNMSANERYQALHTDF